MSNGGGPVTRDELYNALDKKTERIEIGIEKLAEAMAHLITAGEVNTERFKHIEEHQNQQDARLGHIEDRVDTMAEGVTANTVTSRLLWAILGGAGTVLLGVVTLFYNLFEKGLEAQTAALQKGLEAQAAAFSSGLAALVQVLSGS